MKFLYPEILYALSAVTIPILVHLFNFRKFKKVRFSNISFLKEVKIETQSKSKLKHLLVLFSRILAITFIVFAFAQPYIPTEDEQNVGGRKSVSIYVDNSFSMEAENEEGQLLELAKNKALEIVDSYAPTDRFQVLTNDFENRHQRFYGQEEILDLIESVNISPQNRNISEVISRQREMLTDQSESSALSFLISDLQKSTTDISNLKEDSTFEKIFVPTQAESVANVYIDSIWFSSPVQQLNQTAKLNIRIRNTVSQPIENIPMTLTINGVQKALGSFDLVPGEVTDTSLVFANTNPGLKAGLVSIEDHPVVFDDQLYFSYKIEEKISVLEIRPQELTTNNIASVFSGDTHFDFQQMAAQNIDFSEFTDCNLIILNQLPDISSGIGSELTKFAENGGSIYIIPAPDADLNSYNEFFSALGTNQLNAKKSISTEVSNINLDNFIYKDVFDQIPENLDLPKVNAYYSYSRRSRAGEEVLLGLQSGDPFLSVFNVGGGKLYANAVSLSKEESNFTQHAIFVATLLRIAEFSQLSSQLYYTIGDDEAISLRNIQIAGDKVFRLKNVTSEYEFIPEHRQTTGSTDLYVRNQISDAGNFELTLDNQPVALLSFNYPRTESDLEVMTPSELKSSITKNNLGNFKILESGIETISKSVNEIASGIQYWRSCIILALIFLAIEILLIKFWK